MNYDEMQALFSDPGYSLLRNPFGNLPCYFLGVFYPCNPTQALISVQTQVLAQLRYEGAALLFEADHVEAAERADGDIADLINKKVMDTDQLCDLNLYFKNTTSGICVSQEESLVFCASLNPKHSSYLNTIVKEFASDISGSVEPIKKYVKVLSGAAPRYFV